MATVHLARDLKHDRPVALKVLHPDLEHASGSERFQREIRLAARLQHHLNQAIDHLSRAIEAGWRDLAMLDHASEFQRYQSAAIEGLASRLGDA
jgi:serine/threonine protein kinase